MEALASVGTMSVGGGWSQVYGTSGVGAPPTRATGDTAGADSLWAAQSAQSLSSTTTTAGVESFMATNVAAANTNELLGAVLLLLTLEFLKTDNQDEKKSLLALLASLAQQQQQGAGGGNMSYSSSYLSIESTQFQASSSDVAISAYSGASASLQQAPGIDPGAAGLNVIA